VIVSSGWVIDPSDDLVEEFGSVGLSSFAGVVTLPGQDGQELDGGAEVGAGLAGRFHPAVELDRRVHSPLPSMRACASRRSRAMPLVSYSACSSACCP
jgi:hypothetical protein